MADRNTIVQRITLEGAEDIKNALSDIGKAGEKAFAQLSEAASGEKLQGVSDGIGKISDAVKSIGEKFGSVRDNLTNFGAAVGTVIERTAAIGTGVAAAGAAILGLAKSAGSSAADLEKNAQALGLNVEAYQKLKAAAGQSGVAQKTFDSGFKTFTDNFQKSADKAKDIGVDLAKAFNASRDELARDGKPIAGLGNVIEVPKVDTTSLDIAAKRVQDINASLGNTVSFKFVRDRLAELAENSDKVKQQIAAIGAEGLPRNLLEAIDRLKTDTRDTGISLGPVGDALRKMGISIVDAKGDAVSSESAFSSIADKFKALPDGAEKTALAMKLFGKEAGPSLIPLLNQGSKGIADMGDQVIKMGLGFNASQAAVGKDMVGAFARLQFAGEAAKNQIGIIFTPILTQAANALTGAITKNFQSIKEWARYLGGEAKQVVLDFIAVASGRDADVQNGWILKLRDSIKEFGTGVQSITSSVIVPAFTAISAAANAVATVINSVFGTQFTGSALLFVGVLTRIVGGFGLISAAARLVVVVIASTLIPAITSIGGALVALAVANPFVLLVAAAVALGAAIVLVAMNVGGLRDKLVELVTSAPGAAWQWIVDTYNAADQKVGDAMGRLTTTITTFVTTAVSGAWQWIVDTFVTAVSALGAHIAEIATALATLVTTSIGGAWQWLSDSFDGVVDGIKTKFQSLIDYIRSLGASVGPLFTPGQGGADNPMPGSVGGGFAGGGHIRGPGSGTSDSILARLSNGEFVQRTAAVRHYGVDFMNAVNSLQFRLPAFNLGGLVDGFSAAMMPRPLLPAFATGGLVSQPRGGGGLHPLTINLGGGRSVGGLFAAPDAVEGLRKAAFMEQISATGRRSSSVG